MRTQQLKYTQQKGWETVSKTEENINPQLIFAFGSSQLIAQNTPLASLRNSYPNAVFVGGSSAGEITDTLVLDDTIIATLVEFKHSKVAYVSETINHADESFNVGSNLVKKLDKKDLVHVFIMSEGLNINGSELVRGVRDVMPENVVATGGLAGDGPHFKETYILNENGEASKNLVSAIGFYGTKLSVAYGSLGGWDNFGIERLVTKSNKNILFELDGKPALELYKSFLGEYAKDLPSSGLLFPLNLRTNRNDEPVVRTILGVNEENQSLTFAGDIPEGSYVRLMKANFDRLIDGAIGAAESTLKNHGGNKPSLAILISCVGRKLVLKQMVEEEVEGVSDVLGKETCLAGFYSYGEISPFSNESKCELHNQTMTISSFYELD
ncbi:MAG: FIST C-terminal domain-containing protein [Bacteroidia bacterium]|nr:FIST C-terminal domain-containing protein [Bacteroidia bacterium]